MVGSQIIVMGKLLEPDESDEEQEDTSITIVREEKDKLSITSDLGVLLLDAEEFCKLLA